LSNRSNYLTLPEHELCLRRYNAVNGIPMCANTGMLNETLRNSWKFDGYVTSDCGAVQNVWTPEPAGHGYTDKVKATAISVIAGTDIDCGSQYSSEFGAAVEAGELPEAAIDLAVTRLTKAWLRLGLFDPKADQPYFQLGGDVIDSPAHQALATEAAQQGIVLLKNEGVLPLKAGGKVAVVGPHFNVTDVMISNYHGSRCPGKNNFDCIPTVREPYL
jgi:beta-glucosidase-like glycosyl hydrolase